MRYLATFHTVSGAMKYYRHLQKQGIPAETMPVPRRFSSNCGICVDFRFDGDINEYISDDMEKLYLLNEKMTNDKDERLIYSSQDF